MAGWVYEEKGGEGVFSAISFRSNVSNCHPDCTFCKPWSQRSSMEMVFVVKIGLIR